MNKIPLILISAGATLALVALVLGIKESNAQSAQEVAPYQFAELPHGRLYKAVHEGCELFIVESDWRVTGSFGNETYTIATGRGCK